MSSSIATSTLVESTLTPPQNPSTIRVGIDAMGGDYAPASEVGAALQAATNTDLQIFLFGREAEILHHVPASGLPSNVTVVQADDVVGMADEPATIVKNRKESSLYKGLDALREGRIDAFVSVGNTGGVMATATMLCGRLKGVSRPTIGAFFPTQTGRPTLLVDAGANVDSKPVFLRDYGIMGSVYSELILHKERPSVGLLNVGEEEGKGTLVVKEAYDLLKAAPVHFVGNVEGRDILKGTVDIVVCDGFEGNIVLKFAESIIGFLKSRFLGYANTSPFHKLILAAFRPVLRKVLSGMDYQDQGGVPLLGINGVVIIGHGSSSVKAVGNMINRAVEMVQLRVNEHIQRAIAETTNTDEKEA